MHHLGSCSSMAGAASADQEHSALSPLRVSVHHFGSHGRAVSAASAVWECSALSPLRVSMHCFHSRGSMTAQRSELFVSLHVPPWQPRQCSMRHFGSAAAWCSNPFANLSMPLGQPPPQQHGAPSTLRVSKCWFGSCGSAALRALRGSPSAGLPAMAAQQAPPQPLRHAVMLPKWQAPRCHAAEVTCIRNEGKS